MFKIGALVKYDGAGDPVMARVEGFDGRRVRIAILPDGLHLTVGAGDLALPGEDEASTTREISAARWALGGMATSGHGNYREMPLNAQAIEQGDADEGRH